MADRVVSYDFRGNFTSLTAGLAASGRAVTDLGTKLTALDKNGAKMRAGLETVGRGAGIVAIGAAAGLAAIVAVTANFEQAMSKVAATGEEARASLDELRQAAIDAGASTAFSATEAAAGIENLLKAGVSAQDVLGGGLSGALDLAAAGGLEVADAAEIAATALTQFKLSGEDVPHVADLLAAGAGKAQGEVSDLAMALKQSGLVASQMGVSIEETTGTLAAFASAGLLGSDAGTSFRTMLLRLANPTKESATLMQELGINAYDAQGNFVGMASVAEQLKVAFEGKTQAERDSALATIFGSDAIRAASVLYEQGAEGVTAWTNNVNDAGYAAETAATRLDNLKGDLEALKGSLETALIGSGEGSTGILREMTQGVTGLVNAFNGLPGPAKNAASGLLAIAAVTGGALWFGSKVVTGIANSKEALANLGIEAGRAKGALDGLVKAGAALAAFEVTTAILKGLTDQLKTPIDGGTLTRDLEALADGRVTDNLEDLSIWLDDIQDKTERDLNPIAWLSPLDMSGFEDAEKGLKAIDEGLAGLVEGGSGDQAAAVFAELQVKAAEAGLDVAELNNLLPEYDTALKNAGLRTSYWAEIMAELGYAAPEAAAATDQYGNAVEGAGDASESAASSVNELAQAMRDQATAALSAFDAQTNWGAAVRAAQEQVKSGEKGLNALSEAGQNNRQVISGLASAWNAQPRAVKNSQEAYANARSTFIETARAMGVGRQRARELANSLLEVPRKTVAKLEVNDKDAKGKVKNTEKLLADLTAKRWLAELTGDPSDVAAAVAAAKRYLQSINGDVATTYIKTIRTYSAGERTGGGDQSVGADGTTVPKTGLGYADRHPYLLADGEEVISNRHGQADRHRGLLKAINAGRMANGGTTGLNTYSSTNSPNAVTQFGALQFAGNALVTLGQFALEEAKRRRQEARVDLRLAERERDELRKTLEARREERDAILDLRDSLAGTVGGKGSSDIFGDGATIASATRTARQNAANAGELEAAIARLTAAGFSGSALEMLLSQGAYQTIINFSHGSSDDLSVLSQSIGRSLYAQNQAGLAGGNAVYGAQLSRENQGVAAAAAAYQAQVALTKDLQKRFDAQAKAYDRIEKKLDKQIEATKDVGPAVGREIKGPARSAAQRNGRG